MKIKETMAALLSSGVAVSAFAQSSVTLYGVIDGTVLYQSSQTSLGSTSGGHSVVKMAGVWGDRFGFKGQEDLGGGTSAIFTLEAGYGMNTGAQQYSGLLFGRQSFVGLSNPIYGTLTAGRQYTPYLSFVAPYGPTSWLTGFFAAHPGDLDALDVDYHTNNMIVYTSPSMHGFKFGGSYAFGGVPGSVNQGSTWSAALQFANGPFGAAVAIVRFNNSTPGGGAFGVDSTTYSAGQSGVSAITNGYQTAQAQQRIAAGTGYKFGSSWDVNVTYSNVQYIPGINSRYTDIAIFNTVGAVLHWKAAAALDLAFSYAYTRATKANGISDPAQYHQFNCAELYALSKRTVIFGLQGYQRASGKTLGTSGAGNIVDATASIGDGFQGSPSSSRSQFVAGFGVLQRF